MLSLLDMSQAPPPADCVTIMEKDGEMKHSLINVPVPSIDSYPEIVVSMGITHISSQRENVKSAFIPTDRTVWQRALHAWYDQGFSGLFEEIVNSKEEVPPAAASLSAGLLSVLRTVNSLSGSLFPHMSLSNEELVEKFAEVADWARSPVRAFTWHPHTTKFALALQDDSVHVHTAGSALVPTLKHKQQKCVAHLAWQPLSASVLAVACQTCVLIWHVEPMSLATRPSTSSVQVLQQPGHSPVTQLVWDPAGKLLLSGSPTDTAIMAWNVPTESCTPLRRFGGGGISLLSWSPDGSKVMSATPSPIFRVWETTSWNCEVWSQLSGRCMAACWSHSGQVLLFAMERDPILHAVKFGAQHSVLSSGGSLSAALGAQGISGASTAVMVADLSDVTLTSQDEEGVSFQSELLSPGNPFYVDHSVARVGGFVHQMAWNKTSERLAVLFEAPDGEICPLVAIFKTTVHPVVQVLPGGFVKGYKEEVPHHIAFQPSYDKGALLSVVWSSGRVAYTPMYFVPDEHIGTFQFQHSSFNGHGDRHLYSRLS